MEQPEYEVIVVGAGFAGIGAGITLLDAGIKDFLILESAPDIGGTWRDNTYPGVAVDVPFVYSFPFELNPGYRRTFPLGAEIKQYADGVVDKYGLRSYLRFGSAVTEARFDETGDFWRVTLSDGSTLTTRFLVPATGVLARPKPPNLPGLDDFTGTVVHTADWDHDLDLTGQRVAVVGTGASAVQLVPELAKTVARLTVLQRTPIWVFPKIDPPIPAVVRGIFAKVPGAQRLVRIIASAFTELLFSGTALNYARFPYATKVIELLCRAHLFTQVRDRSVRAKLVPKYGFGCKRPTMSNAYWRSFTREHVDLVDGGVQRVTAGGIVGGDGVEREIDTLVLATGFLTTERGNIPSFPVYGLGGTELGEFWQQHRYQAYEGTSVPNMPNFWLMFGPYQFTGVSYFGLIESAANHFRRCIVEARRRGATRVLVSQEAHDRYFADMQDRLRRSIFTNNCAGSNSYYFDARGDAPFLRPTSTYQSIRQSKRFPLTDYSYQ
ncbi:NAD(P)/FAD-dependent oxidoreductase [Pseudonocardiaceae bacterium YIM PH 21723]|nr:NAD(P)/FAD-dependent oxidoreductase [Pseudonocardiaceae bacterium YIM PH 21723]